MAQAEPELNAGWSAPRYNVFVRTLQRMSGILWAGCALAILLAGYSVRCQEAPPSEKNSKQSAKEQAQAKEQNEQQDLQKAIENAGNDRAALVRNLEAFLKNYPQSQQRSQIYRAIVESSLKVDDYARATDYAERMVALRPDDASINVLAIQLLERNGDAAGWRRAISYCTRVLDLVDTNFGDRQIAARIGRKLGERQETRRGFAAAGARTFVSEIE